MPPFALSEHPDTDRVRKSLSTLPHLPEILRNHLKGGIAVGKRGVARKDRCSLTSSPNIIILKTTIFKFGGEK
jgi:hypothetical protein